MHNSISFNERNRIVNCLEREMAFCTVKCPFHLNLHEFLNKVQRGNFDTAFRDFRNSVGFPEITLELCQEYCKDACPRGLKDEAIEMKLLERAALKYANKIDPSEYNVPIKSKRIAIIGAGISGLSCALRLCEKKYQIDVYEKTENVGGYLWNIMNPGIFLRDFNRQFMYEKCNIFYNTEITEIQPLRKEYDAVYVATGKDGNTFSLKANKNCFTTNMDGVFIGGMVIGQKIIEAQAHGLEAGKQIEAYLKTGIMIHPLLEYCTKMPEPDMNEYPRRACIIDDKEKGFSKEEAKLEAQRCIRCACDACKNHCDLLSFYKKSPLKALEEVRATTEVKGVMGNNMTIATKLISACDQCGLCAEVCPVGIDLKKILLEARRVLKKRGDLPWAFNDFFLREMTLSNSKQELLILSENKENPKYLFFPGCQLGASDPRYVIESYKKLLKKISDLALMVRCCGAPAVWAGNEDLQEDTFEAFREIWYSMGKPELIFACPTCRKIFEEYLPDVKGLYLYHLLMDSCQGNRENRNASVFDPCNSRGDSNVQDAVRDLATVAGYILKPLKYEGNMAKCCGFGGNNLLVNPDFRKEVVEKRIGLSDETYITYCINCRDIFAEYGKKSLHILDIALGLNDEDRLSPTISQKRKNRDLLKNTLLKEFYGISIIEEGIADSMNLKISGELQKKLHKRLIFEDDVKDVIKHCEETGNKIISTNAGTYIGYKKIGYMTYWVEYRSLDEGFELVNAYCHRISIEG